MSRLTLADLFAMILISFSVAIIILLRDVVGDWELVDSARMRPVSAKAHQSVTFAHSVLQMSADQPCAYVSLCTQAANALVVLIPPTLDFLRPHFAAFTSTLIHLFNTKSLDSALSASARDSCIACLQILASLFREF